MKKSGPANTALAEIVRIDDLIKTYVTTRKVFTMADIREFKWLRDCRRNEVRVIENAGRNLQ
jgi:hypothetical protein